MPKGPFSKIEAALTGKKRPAEGEGVKRRAQTDDEFLRAKREAERIARRVEERRKLMQKLDK